MDALNALVRERLAKADDIEPLLKDFFLSPRLAVLYGAGHQSKVLMELCHMFGKKIECVVVSAGQAVVNPNPLIPVSVYEVTRLPTDMDKSNYDIIISMHEKHNREILPDIQKYGFTHVFYSECWFKQNELLRNLWYEVKLQFYGAVVRDTEKGRCLECHCGRNKDWKLYFPDDDPILISNIFGTFHDIVLPSIFDDDGFLTEGPYEYGHVFLQEGDAVFDLGANVGLFSTVALAKGCQVWAFEPTPMTLDILHRNLSLYSDGEYTICPYAVTDTTGKATLNINEDFSQDMSLGSNSLKARKGFAAISVDTVSLDDFVEQNGMNRVDFIKADIEGAERLMLKGAKRTLARFAPKLALCTYHLPDDPEVMERLILDANPEYVIEHKWAKLYAHCREP